METIKKKMAIAVSSQSSAILIVDLYSVALFDLAWLNFQSNGGRGLIPSSPLQIPINFSFYFLKKCLLNVYPALEIGIWQPEQESFMRQSPPSEWMIIASWVFFSLFNGEFFFIFLHY